VTTAASPALPGSASRSSPDVYSDRLGEVRASVLVSDAEGVMITLPQGDLPEDSGIPRTAAQHNAVNVGVYASVVSGGTIHRGDPVTLT